ncbi:SHOCT domain-containing protein [Embleya sp. NBC_00896]|uniref:SHOCT domain-containing protein n=1 Tax=Embleya sp. NBC_00896 TaxID=2975961 RepID=UPI002F912762|nr:SHOCT domain-containing protein [Embleya sp. NBC_00896]
MDDYPLLNAFLTMMWLFLWILWFFLLFRIITDIFRDDSLSGWGKTGWLVFVIVLPFLGVFVYIMARGSDMGRRDIAQAKQQDEAFQAYVRDAAGTNKGSSGVEELSKLAQLKSNGDISVEEYERAKQKLLA